MEIKQFAVGDVLFMKKNHACSANAKEMAVLMTGSDIKVRCVSCGREMIIPRVKLEKNIKRIARKE